MAGSDVEHPLKIVLRCYKQMLVMKLKYRTIVFRPENASDFIRSEFSQFSGGRPPDPPPQAMNPELHAPQQKCLNLPLISAY